MYFLKKKILHEYYTKMKNDDSKNVKVCCLLNLFNIRAPWFHSGVELQRVLTQGIEGQCDSCQAKPFKEAQGAEHWDVDREGHCHAED